MLCCGQIGKIGGMSKVKRDSGPSFLYLFDADTLTVGTPPLDVVSEDSSNAYEIVDAGGVLGKGLRKKTANTTTKRAFFNGYATFPVAVKASFYFYMTNLASFQFLFGMNLINSANSGGQVLGLQRDASTGQAKHNGWTANTNAGFISSNGALDLVGGGYNYQIPLSTGVEYIAECWINPGTNKQRMRISADGGETRFNTVEMDSPRAQAMIGFLDGVGMTPQLHLKRVEVLPLV